MSRSEGNADPSHRFTGQKLDPESGLYYYGGRYYDAELGRFISPDISVPQPKEPQSLNRYSYVLNNPVRIVDPTGAEVGSPEPVNEMRHFPLEDYCTISSLA